MPTTHERITNALELLTLGLCPFVERELKAVYKDKWIETARTSFRDDRKSQPAGEAIRWDAHALLTVLWNHWNGVFQYRLGQFERSLVSELREYRNRWAHQAEFSFDDAYRFVDSCERLLAAVDAAEAADVRRAKREILEDEFGAEANAATRRIQVAKNNRVAIIVYVTCCAALVLQLFNSLGVNQALALSIAIVAFFAYAIRKRLVSQPLFFGPHECRRCGKIIYGEPCPYCAAVTAESDTASGQSKPE